MIERNPTADLQQAGHSARALETAAPITIFTIPKAFEGHFGLIQRNAIRSWAALENVEVLVLGDDPGVAETSAELDVAHLGGLAVNEQGTPLLSDAFRLAREHSDSQVLVYCNADVILLTDFTKSILRLVGDDQFEQFLAIGRRTELDVVEEIAFDDGVNARKLLQRVKLDGKLAPVVCKEYFAFRRDQFQNIPEFAVGRGNWDNWMVARAKSDNVPVVDLSSCVTAIHQQHDYSHTGQTRMECYVSGEEARENQRLAGSRNWVGGSTPTWKMTPAGDVRRCAASWMNLAFWCDLPRFSKLVFRLFGSRK